MKTIRILSIVVIILGCVVAGSMASFKQVQSTRQDVLGILHQWLVEGGVQAIELAQRAVRGGAGPSAPIPVEQPPEKTAAPTPALDDQQEPDTPAPAATPAPTAVDPSP